MHYACCVTTIMLSMQKHFPCLKVEYYVAYAASCFRDIDDQCMSAKQTVLTH
jgi:hypothetical protein